MRKIKISKAVWDSLTEPEQEFVVKWSDRYGLNDIKQFLKACRIARHTPIGMTKAICTDGITWLYSLERKRWHTPRLPGNAGTNKQGA